MSHLKRAGAKIDLVGVRESRTPTDTKMVRRTSTIGGRCLCRDQRNVSQLPHRQFLNLLPIRNIARQGHFSNNPAPMLRNEYSLGVIRFRGAKGDLHPASCDESGAVRSGFSYPASFYMDAYHAYQSAMTALTANPALKEMDLTTARAKLFEHRARARWALATKGLEALPFALQMLHSSDMDERDDARGILCRMGTDDEVVDTLLDALRDTADPEILADLIVALGATANARAIPALVSILRNPAMIDFHKSAAIKSLGKLAQRRFDQTEDPFASLNAWLEANGYSSLPVGTPKIPQIATLRHSANRGAIHPLRAAVELTS